MKKARILIVEDELIVAEDLFEGLEKEGYEVVAKVSNADQALEKCLEPRVDLVVIDIKFGGRDEGLEAAGLIRAELDIPLVYLTDHPKHPLPVQEDCLQSSPCVIEPFREEELYAIIQAILKESERNTE
ncbi:MAG: response regulator [Desulfomonilaceae bacterium]